MFLWQLKAYMAKESRRLAGALLDGQIRNSLQWRCLRVRSTPEPVGEKLRQTFLGGWDPRGAADPAGQHV